MGSTEFIRKDPYEPYEQNGVSAMNCDSDNTRLLTCTCTYVAMSAEADALNAHIISPVLVESVLEGVGGRSIQYPQRIVEVDSSLSQLFG